MLVIANALATLVRFVGLRGVFGRHYRRGTRADDNRTVSAIRAGGAR